MRGSARSAHRLLARLLIVRYDQRQYPYLQSTVALLQVPITQLVYACQENQSISCKPVSREALLTASRKSRIQSKEAPAAAAGNPKLGPVPAAGPPTMTPGNRRLIAEAYV